MLRLKDLFENFDLAYEILKEYDYDVEKTKKVINYFRISATMIYPFYNDKGLNFLRLSPVYERDFDQTKGEIELVEYLSKNGLNVLQVLKMKDGDKVKTIKTEFGEFIVCAFKRVCGSSLEEYFEDNEVSSEIIKDYGRALGKLHSLTKGIKNVNRRNHLDYINLIEQRLLNYCPNKDMIQAFLKIKEEFLKMPVTDGNYGLIHYDAELDNVFYDKEAGFSFIDFDDCHYNFYALDIERSLNEVERLDKRLMGTFLEGYKEYMSIDELNYDFFKKLSFIEQYANIYYTLSEDVKEKPEWMEDIVEELTTMIRKFEEAVLDR